MKESYKFIIIAVLSLFVVQGNSYAQGFIRHDTLIGVLPNRYIDPEISISENLMVFQDYDNKIWIAEIDPLTGHFVSVHGRDYLIDTKASAIPETRNGPEWGVDRNGWSIFYSKISAGGIKQIWRAMPPWQNPIISQLTNTTMNAGGNVASLNSNSNTTYLAQWRQNGNYFFGGYIDITQPNTFFSIPGVWATNDPFSIAIRPVLDADLMIASSNLGSYIRQIVKVDLATNTLDTLTNDSLGKYDPWGFFAPEYNNELLMQSTVNYNAIAIYRDMGQKYWQLIDTIKMPDSATHKKVRSVESFVVNDTTWFVFEAFNDTTSYFSETSIWLANLGNDPKDCIFRRLDEEGGNGIYCGDPEYYIGKNEVFVYYNLNDHKGRAELRLCKTGIKTESTTSINDLLSLENVTFHPNPAKEIITISNLPASFNGTVVIYNAMGQLIQTEQRSGSQFRIQTGHLLTGVYLVQVRTEKEEIITKKFVKE